MTNIEKITKHLDEWVASKGWVVRYLYRIIKKELIEEIQKILDKLNSGT